MRSKNYARSVIYAGLLGSFIFAWQALQARALEFHVELATNMACEHFTGRLVVILSRAAPPKPDAGWGRIFGHAACLLGSDVNDFGSGKTAVVDENAITFPLNKFDDLPAGHYFVSAVLSAQPLVDSPDTSNALCSTPREFDLNPRGPGVITIQLDQHGPPESVPADTEFIKFLKLPSRLLTQFHGHPMFLRAGIVLPSDYFQHPTQHYPVWVRVGGLGARYWSVKSLMDEKSDFRKTWDAPDTPRMILLQLDGAGPFGDPYQVNSANNGPYGDAIIQELLPEVERRFRCEPHARVLSGVSTGGWAALGLQIFYPEEFDGVWASCPDPVDFRAFELINIYQDTNAYVNTYGFERPSERNVDGDTKLTVRRELQIENVVGRGGSWTMSGGQWCAWNAVFGPRGADGFPEKLWDPKTGVIDRSDAEAWKKYDLHLYLQEHWKTLGPKLRGKLHIAAAEADNYFLNDAVHRLDEFLSRAEPPYKGTIVYGLRKTHGWNNLSLKAMLLEMQAAVGGRTNAAVQP